MALDKTRNFFRNKRKELALLAVSTLLSLGFSIPAYDYLIKTKHLWSIMKFRTAYESAQNGTSDDSLMEIMSDDAIFTGLQKGDLKLSKDPRRVYEFVPKMVSASGTFNYFNHGGYRDYDYPETKSKNTFRIGMFGDSFTGCWGISDNTQSYPKTLEIMVNQVPNLSRKYQFLNFGCTGYNTLTEVSLFQKEALRFDLDMAVLQFLDNDCNQISGQCDSDVYSAKAVNALSSVMGGKNPKFREFFDDLLKRMKKIAVPKGMDLYLLSHYYPDRLNDGKRPQENNLAMDVAKENDFRIIDIWDMFDQTRRLYCQEDSDESDKNKGIYFLKVCSSDGHPSILSNKRASLYILEHVLPSIPEGDREKIRDFYFNGGYRRHFQSYDARRMLPSLPKKHLDEINDSMKERLEDYFKAVSN